MAKTPGRKSTGAARGGRRKAAGKATGKRTARAKRGSSGTTKAAMGKRPAAAGRAATKSSAKSPAAKASSKTTAAKPRTAKVAPAGKPAPPSRRRVGAARPVPARAPAKRRAAKPPQRFVANHLSDASFAEGLRTYAQYRDLGIGAATTGLVQAHVIRFVPPCRPEEVSKLHFHDVDFQMIYVLKGWIKSEFAGEGVHVFAEGACWLQPPRIEHRVLDYSDDCEVLEIIMPADFATVTLD